MKILFFIESLEAGGKERRLVELLKVLSSKINFTIEIVLTRTGIAYQEIKDLNIKIHFIERKLFKKDPLLFYKFYKIAKEFKPDLIHVWGNMVAIYAIPAKVFLKIPMINSQITDAPEKIYSGILGHKLPFFFSDLIIANSNAGLIAYNAPQNKSSVIYNGFNFNRLRQLKAKAEIREQFSINTKYIIGMVATFSKAKDYKTYINAAIEVLNKNKDVTFLCVGAGDDSKIRAMIEDSFEEKIIFTGYQSDVESIMNCCDIGVLSTFREGISNSVLEFMALGKPMIVTGGGGTLELIENSVSGIIIESGNSELLAEKILSFLDNPDEMEKMGTLAKSRIETKFSMAKMTESFLAIYNSFSNN